MAVEDHAPHGQRTSLIERHFTLGHDQWDYSVNWTTRTARAGDFVQEGVEAPDFWSDNSVGIVAKLYFATVDGVRETSVKQMIERVAGKITEEGIKHGYFQTPIGEAIPSGDSKAQIFYDELCCLLVNQMGTFNSPVWFNVGVPGRPQCCSACFLLKVEDTMFKGDHSIVKWWETEARIFKMGAGSGINVSKIRASGEPLSTGGEASGPSAYVRASDTAAGTLKSGGAHRRAAKMVCYDADHPDIEDLIDSKVREDRRMRILKEAGEEINPFTRSGEKVIAEATSFQNENQSVCVTDDFMRKASGVDSSKTWELTARTTGEPVETLNARELMHKIAEAAWTCGDPGMIFIDAVNRMHTTPSLGPITTCNPCGETWLNDNSSCNLASLNLVRFLDDQGDVRLDDYQAAIDVFVLAMDITCSFSDLPTPEVERNTRELRQLGLGYANLGAALMIKGLPYDSEEGRDWAAAMTAILTGHGYLRSAKIAEEMGAYDRFDENRDAHLTVIKRHIAAIPFHSGGLWSAAETAWSRAAQHGIEHGFRNSQLTVIPPTGTTSFMLGTDSTGCEPLFSLVGSKGLAGGGTMTWVAGCVERSLKGLGYSQDLIDGFLSEARNGEPLNRLVRGSRSDIFDCANDISPEGHVKMVAAIQPFLSGAPSKTVNLPESATVEDIQELYVLAWKLGAKAITVFRHNSKVTSILDHTPQKKEEPAPREKDAGSTEHTRRERVAQGDFTTSPPSANERRALPRDVRSFRHKMTIGDHKAYIHVGTYEDGKPGEIFVSSAGSEGSFVQGMWSALAKITSLALQYGVPLEALVHQLANDEFEPKGMTGNSDIPEAKSMVSYVFRWMASQFMGVDEQEAMGILTPAVKQRMTERLDAQVKTDQSSITVKMVSPLITTGNGNGHTFKPGTRPCSCGSIMTQTGACFTCSSCGANTGCG